MRIQTKHRHKATRFEVYIETTIEKKLIVSALDKEEAEELAITRLKERQKTLARFPNKKLIANEVVDIVEVKYVGR